MKVLHVYDCWPVTGDLVQGLKSLGVEANIFDPTIGTYRATKVKRVMLPITRTWEAYKLRRLVDCEKYDVVHVHYASLAYMTLITGIPYFLHCHGSDLRRDFHRPGLKQVIRMAVKRAVKVFYVTPDLEHYIKEIRGDGIFLPNPIQLEKFTPIDVSLTPNANISNADILCISKLEPYKGVDEIIKAIEQIWEARPKTTISIFQQGNSEAAQYFFNKHNGDNRLIKLNPIPHDQMPELIRSHGIVLGQQSKEVGALGVSELEAMACGKPVMCYYRFPEAYLEPPPILNTTTSEDICSQTIRLLDDASLRRSQGEQARRWVSKYHASQNVATRLFNYYDSYLS